MIMWREREREREKRQQSIKRYSNQVKLMESARDCKVRCLDLSESSSVVQFKGPQIRAQRRALPLQLDEAASVGAPECPPIGPLLLKSSCFF